MRFPFPPDLVQALTGARVTGLGRRAKYGLIHTDREQTMVFHLGMSGRWRIDPETPDKHDHLLARDRRPSLRAERSAPLRLRSIWWIPARSTPGRHSPRWAPSRSGRA